MTFVDSNRMEWLCQRCHKETLFHSVLRSVLLLSFLLLVLSVSMYPGLWSIGVQLHSALTGSYVPGHHSVLLINSPNEQAAKDIGRAIMERRMAASINILPRTSTMYYWKGEVQDATEILMLVKTKTSRIQKVIDYVYPPLCESRGSQLPSGGGQSGLYEVDG
ncbi:protein CutA homolog isoform X2 [Myripristis murdjan]|uniref:protein CutA homolog isoform X2 n=1 Tax=Myripristis murdjan TaxID=586833 RepID=UPI001176229F|nr:protein CutA homolog isoform X2 [Myripristis murdjan]